MGNAVEVFDITVYEIAAIGLATGMSYDWRALPPGFVYELCETRKLWATLPVDRTISDMARAYLERRMQQLDLTLTHN